jgi:hypothetical protein
MLIELLVGQLFLALFNLGNAFFDAYRILHNKTIAHAVNFGAYVIFAAVLCWLFSFSWIASGLFFLSAFFNRQFTFDIPLNLRRGLDWDYQSIANPPKSITDRIERAIFGVGPNVGKRIAKAYAVCYGVIITIWIWVV